MVRDIKQLLFCIVAMFSAPLMATTYVPITVGDITVIIPIDDPPIARPETISIDEDSTKELDVLFNDEDESLEQVQITIVSPSDLSTLNGTLVQNGNVLTYTPAPNAYGNNYDSFDYYLTDIEGNTSDVVTVQINVDPINDAPYNQFSEIENVWVDEDATPTFNGLFAFRDVENDPLKVVEVRPTIGTSAIINDSSFYIYPPEHYHGKIFADVYVSDNDKRGMVRWELIYVSKDDPTEVSGFVKVRTSGRADVGVTLVEPDGVPEYVKVEITGPGFQDSFEYYKDQPQTYNIRPNHQYYYAWLSDAMFDGNYRLTVTGRDEKNIAFDPWTLDFTVAQGNLPPVAVDDEFTAEATAENYLPVTANDFDLNADDTITLDAILQQPAHGTLEIVGNNLKYTPDATEVEKPDATRYRIRDSHGVTAEASVALRIIPTQPIDSPTNLRMTVRDSNGLETAVIEPGTSIRFDWDKSPNHDQYTEFRLGKLGRSGGCATDPLSQDYCLARTSGTSATIVVNESGDLNFTVQACFGPFTRCSTDSNSVLVKSHTIEISDFTISPSPVRLYSSALMQWSEVHGNSPHYYMDVLRPGLADIEENWAVIPAPDGRPELLDNHRRPTFHNLGTYKYRVKGCNSDLGCSANFTYATVDVMEFEPLVINGLQVSENPVMVGNEVTVSWLPVNESGVYYNVQVGRTTSTARVRIETRTPNTSTTHTFTEDGSWVFDVEVCHDVFGCSEEWESIVVEVTPSNQSLSYEYDDFGRLWKVLQGETVVIEYTYDNAGNRTSVQYNQ